ncbi:hypothetical protein [Mesorhizobium sp.]|nr:hypothetical protein [Mesorhizobium sp.]
MRIGHIELSFGADDRKTHRESGPKRSGFSLHAGEALLHVGRFSWLLTW